MTISQIEDTIAATLRGLNIFQTVDSAGRKAFPVSYVYPSAYVYFAGDRDTGVNPRPTYELEYAVIVMAKSVRDEPNPAIDVYSVLDLVRNAINKKTLGIENIEPWTCVSREAERQEGAIISYTLTFKTRQFLPVP